MKPLYLAGPMTGIRQFNYPVFHAAAAWLRRIGYEIISPAEQDSASVQAAAMSSETGELVDGGTGGESYGSILGRDVQIMVDQARGIVLLPGWERSRGARLETFAAILCGHELFEYVEAAHPVSRSPEWIKERLL